MTSPPGLTPQIIFEDTHLIVLSKPAGLLSQSDHSGESSLVDWLRVYLNRNYVGLVHRLDRNTSGLLVCAKRTKSAQRLTTSLQKGTLLRKYSAILKGELTSTPTWVHWMIKNEKTNKVTLTRQKMPLSKICELKILTVQNFPTMEGMATLCEIQLETGRSHQIRAQCAFEKHPLFGDIKYGSPSALIARPALHSTYLSFPHPMSGEVLAFTDPLPEDMRNLIRT